MPTLLTSFPQLFANIDANSYLQGMNGDGRLMLAFLLFAGVTAVVATIATTADRIHRRITETALKRDMIERGLSAEEMERILSVKRSTKV